jgi:two-component system heavy metal sensor histidine kinase CusS
VLVETAGMSSELPAAVFPDAVDLNAQEVETRDIRTQGGRAYRLGATKGGGGAYTLQVAVDLTFEKDLLAGYRRKLRVVLGLGLIASILIGRRIAIRGLRPLNEISETVRQIRSTNLREHMPLDRMPSEVQELASTFNNMLDRLGDSFERLSRFSSDIAHELRTPLNNLRGEIDLALSKGRSADEYIDLLGSLSEECEQLARIIDSLLFLARAEQPAMQINREPLDIARELRLVCDFYEPAAAEAGVQLSVSAPENLESRLDRTLFSALWAILFRTLSRTHRAVARSRSLHVTGLGSWSSPCLIQALEFRKKICHACSIVSIAPIQHVRETKGDVV